MTFPPVFPAAALAGALLIGSCASLPAGPPRAPLLLVSIDGLRPGDITDATMPHLARLGREGVRADGMRPSYPSLTFPNHYTLVTGLRPDRHGITHNSMWDRDLGEFRLSRRDAVGDGRWWGGEPVWIGAQRAGLRAATLFWPGSEAAIAGQRPQRWMPYDGAMPDPARVDRVAGWLSEPAATRPDFATLYFDHVDHASHAHGPASAEADAARRGTDAAIGRLVERLRAARLLGRVNLVIVSDHGFAEVPAGQAIAVEDMVARHVARADSVGQVVTFNPLPGMEARAAARLIGRHAHYQCWPKAALPPRWHYGRHARVPAIVCQMDAGWDALPRASIGQRAKAGSRGSHGYDPDLPDMRASFIAHGPAFRPGARLPVFDNVDVYPLLMRLLRVPAAPNDGDARTFDGVLIGGFAPAH